MEDKTEYTMELYIEGVVAKMPVVSAALFAREREFLEELTGLPPVDESSEPGQVAAFSMLTKKRWHSYLNFRKTLREDTGGQQESEPG